MRGHGHGHGPRGPHRRRGWRRWRKHRHTLRRRLFLWFVLAISATGCTVGLVMQISGGKRWEESLQRLQSFAAGRFEQVWDDVEAREELADAVARDLDVNLTLLDVDGRVLRRGQTCRAPHRVVVPGRGSVVACLRGPGPPHGPVFLALGLAVFVLMGLSGVLAARLGRPLREVARVAKKIGEGDLEARVSHRYHGEEGLLATTVNEMAARIGRQLAEQRELLAAVSHEMRTPLGHIRLLLELAREGDENAIEELEREVAEMDDLVGELLVRSRLDFQDVDRRPLDAVELARRALERQGLDAGLLQVDGDAQVVGDATLLARALANLIDNAERHGGGLVSLEVVVDGAVTAFELRDGGPGFDLELAAPFSRGDHDGHGETGLGLGLSLVRRIALAHGGDLEVQAEPDGCTVRLSVAAGEVAADPTDPIV